MQVLDYVPVRARESAVLEHFVSKVGMKAWRASITLVAFYDMSTQAIVVSMSVTQKATRDRRPANGLMTLITNICLLLPLD